jgi:hypothetical protein
MKMKPSLLKILQSVDTPTVCNAIEVAQGKRGFDAFTRGTMHCSAPHEPAIVGYARTAKIAAIKKNVHSLTLSAIVPDTIETVVAQNTIWKYQSDPSE